MKVWVSVDVYTCQPPVLIKNIYYELFRKNQVITMQTPSDKKIYKEKKKNYLQMAEHIRMIVPMLIMDHYIYLW